MGQEQIWVCTYVGIAAIGAIIGLLGDTDRFKEKQHWFSLVGCVLIIGGCIGAATLPTYAKSLWPMYFCAALTCVGSVGTFLQRKKSP